MELLRIEGMSKIYGKGESAATALDNVSLSVEKGEFVAIIGSSGSGKASGLSSGAYSFPWVMPCPGPKEGAGLRLPWGFGFSLSSERRGQKRPAFALFELCHARQRHTAPLG
ncbi:MAG: ATP-binding cassette domain-containing protein, partial [Eubacteriaceae bacterium]|nr:ATP-binding cassette domain-containing protein [Eubacteriaceae bacterium]